MVSEFVQVFHNMYETKTNYYRSTQVSWLPSEIDERHYIETHSIIKK